MDRAQILTVKLRKIVNGLSHYVSVFTGVGERTREGNDLLREMIESGVMKYGKKFAEGMERGEWNLADVAEVRCISAEAV